MTSLRRLGSSSFVAAFRWPFGRSSTPPSGSSTISDSPSSIPGNGPGLFPWTDDARAPSSLSSLLSPPSLRSP